MQDGPQLLYLKKKIGFLAYYKNFFQSMYTPETVAGLNEKALVEQTIKEYQNTVKRE